MTGCKCYDWSMEEKEETFKHIKGSWTIKSKGGDLRRIYFCPMCGDKLGEASKGKK